MTSALIVAVIGAPSTGKTRLSTELRDTLAAEGHSVATANEYLHEWRQLHTRTPLLDEWHQIAEQQSARIAAAARHHDIVIADTTALMGAACSEFEFGDTSLYAAAVPAHRRCTLSLLMALDLPCAARTGGPACEQVDALIRAALQRAELPYAVVTGDGPFRLASALKAVRHALKTPSAVHEAAANPRWRWMCERCGDPACERHMLPRQCVAEEGGA